MSNQAPAPRLFQRCLLRPGDLAPSQDDLRVIGVFNPGAAQTPGGVVLLARVAENIGEKRRGWVALPRWDATSARVECDWLRGEELAWLDPRVVVVKQTGLRRLTFISHLRVFHCGDGRSIDGIGPARFMPAAEGEEFGVEDPRVTALEGRFYFTYVAVSRHGAATALASTMDFQSFERHGVILAPENKDVVLFPEKIGGLIMALHRPNPAQHFSPPEMWLAASPDFIHWGRHEWFLGAGANWDAGRIGAGTPPVRTDAGWLEIYHGNARPPGGDGIGAYSAGALLLDLDNPRRILGARGPVLVPQTDYEREGFVPDVVFPTGIVPQGETALIYYGAADEVAAVVELRLKDLL
ncbi:MAG TPA: glycoside hydrolase family 130 protein [Verrucomicrobiae bacterium]|jgi:predicted GH43/DUF377 family glycosyl hydrolase